MKDVGRSAFLDTAGTAGLISPTLSNRTNGPMKPTQTLLDLVSLQNRVAVITGGASGIGLGVAWRLAEAGAG